MKTFKNIAFTSLFLGSVISIYAVDAVKLKISGNNYSDEAVIRFISGATDGIDNDYDALKLFSSNKQVPAIYTMVDAQSALVVNSCPLLTSELNINIYVRNYIATTYTINAYEFGSIPSSVNINLEDVKTGSSYNMRSGTSYTFSLSADSVAQQPRFVLHFVFPVTEVEKPSAPSVLSAVYCQGDSIAPLMASSSDGGNIKWYNDSTLNDVVAVGSSYYTGNTLPGTYTYYVTQTDNSGSQSLATEVSLVINSLPETPTVSNVEACENQAIPELSASASSGKNGIKWYSDVQLNSLAGIGNTFIPAITSSAVFYVIQTDVNGCSSAPGHATVTIFPAPFRPLVSGITEYCEGETMQLSATGQNVTWYSSIDLNNKVHSGNAFTHIAKETAVLYAIQSINNCVSTAVPVPVTVNPLPAVNISGVNSRYSVNDGKIVLDGIPAGGIFTGSGIIGDQFDPSVAGDGGHIITYAYTDNKGCINTTTSLITIGETQQSTGIVPVLNSNMLSMFPNPALEQTMLSFEMTIKGKVQIDLYDATGKNIVLQPLTDMEAGKHNFEINRASFNLSTGVYWVKINAANEQSIVKVLFQ